MLYTLLAFIVTIIVIVAIHEYGHYLAMRLFGVRVLKFSIGFGPRLLGWRNRAGTEFVVSGIPLGGYVKPLDRRDSEVAPEEADQEFSGKPVWQRIITYAAGPAANLVLALLLYWAVLLNGQTVLAPVVADVEPDSAAANAGMRAGDEIQRIGDDTVQGWSGVGGALMHYAGETGEIPVTVKGAEGQVRELSLSLAPWAEDLEQPPLGMLGITPRPPRAIAGELVDGGPADRAGLEPGDLVLAINGNTVENWSDWVEYVRAHPGETMELTVFRDGAERRLQLTPEPVQSNGETIGRVGVMAGDMRVIEYGVLSAVPAAFVRLWDQTSMILRAIGRMIAGQLSLETLGGPITIANAAGQTAAIGLGSFALFLAFFSVSLGIINLLPIPMLDGGWIMFGLIEWIRGRELPERFLMMAQSVGITAVMALMALAIYNDLVRHFG
jgi:regulator of sigma E protease